MDNLLNLQELTHYLVMVLHIQQIVTIFVGLKKIEQPTTLR